jgi:hypothetical protein
MGGLVPISGQLGGLLRNPTEIFMDGIAALPAGFRRRREKVFGEGRCQPLDRNAKARIMVLRARLVGAAPAAGPPAWPADAGHAGGAGGAVVGLPGVGSGYVQKVVTRRNGHCPRKLTFLDAGYRLLSN